MTAALKYSLRSYSPLLFFFLGIFTCISAQPVNQAYRNDTGLHSAMLGLGGGLTTLSIALDKGVAPFDEATLQTLDPSQVPGIDRYSTRQFSWKAASFSDGVVLGSFAAPFLLLIDKPGRDNFGQASLIAFQGLLINSSLVSLTKVLVQRPRPYLYNPAAPREFKFSKNSRYSFFSGHTSTTSYFAFATASMFDDIYPDSNLKPYVWGTAILLPALTAYGRMRAGRHFFTDVLVGYIVGAVVGIVVPALHR